MENHDLAWAAGFFDGEGWANRQRRGVNSRINQAGLDGVPEVLTKFHRIVGVGRIHGPVIVEGRQPLYYWDATSRPDLLQVVERIGPWLCPVKRAEFERTLGGPLPAQVWPGSMSEELAWAGGFFDGEGSTYLEKHRTHPGYFYPVTYVPQSAEVGIAAELLRLRSAMGGIGNISGIRQDGINNLDLAIIKNTQLKEGVQLQLRFEGINALNHPQFLDPNVSPSSSAFGQVTATFASPRTVLLAAKILF